MKIKKPVLLWSRCYCPTSDNSLIPDHYARLSRDTAVNFCQHEETTRDKCSGKACWAQYQKKTISTNTRSTEMDYSKPWLLKNHDLLAQARTDLQLQLVLIFPFFPPLISQWLCRPFQQSIIKGQQGLGCQMNVCMSKRTATIFFPPPILPHHIANACQDVNEL